MTVGAVVVLVATSLQTEPPEVGVPLVPVVLGLPELQAASANVVSTRRMSSMTQTGYFLRYRIT